MSLRIWPLIRAIAIFALVSWLLMIAMQQEGGIAGYLSPARTGQSLPFMIFLVLLPPFGFAAVMFVWSLCEGLGVTIPRALRRIGLAIFIACALLFVAGRVSQLFIY